MLFAKIGFQTGWQCFGQKSQKKKYKESLGNWQNKLIFNEKKALSHTEIGPNVSKSGGPDCIWNWRGAVWRRARKGHRGSRKVIHNMRKCPTI